MNWHEINASFCVRFVMGDKYGMLCIQQMCPCGHGYVAKDYFFAASEQDHIFMRCMCPMFNGKLLRIYLPNGDQGSFELTSSCHGFSDDYVLELLVSICWWQDSEEFTAGLLFDTIRNRIRMRTMFKKFYFRCLRLAFKPGRNQAILAQKAYGKDMEQVFYYSVGVNQ
jgi:hypothetical protein